MSSAGAIAGFIDDSRRSAGLLSDLRVLFLEHLASINQKTPQSGTPTNHFDLGEFPGKNIRSEIVNPKHKWITSEKGFFDEDIDHCMKNRCRYFVGARPVHPGSGDDMVFYAVSFGQTLGMLVICARALRSCGFLCEPTSTEISLQFISAEMTLGLIQDSVRTARPIMIHVELASGGIAYENSNIVPGRGYVLQGRYADGILPDLIKTFDTQAVPSGLLNWPGN